MTTSDLNDEGGIDPKTPQEMERAKESSPNNVAWWRKI